jgi:magnesium transporter
MEPDEAEEVLQLEQYPPDTAGGIMTSDFTALSEDLTVEDAIVELRRLSEENETMWYVYVVDRREHLVGVLSIRDMILARPGRRLNQIMRTQVFTVLATMDQEEVARLFRKYNYLVMPVVDASNRLVGLITFDDAIDVIEEEATEDAQKLFGAGAAERPNSSWLFSLRKRLAWTEVRLVAAFGAAAIVSRFDRVIGAVPLLAAGLVMISAVSSNSVAQAMVVGLRGITAGNDRRTAYRMLLRELLVGITAGLAVGVSVGAAVSWGLLGTGLHDHYNPLALAGVIAAAMAANHTIACLMAIFIPWLLKRLRLDPAQSSFIWATALTDCTGFAILLTLAHLIIR